MIVFVFFKKKTNKQTNKKGWSLSVDQLKLSFDNAKAKKITPRALVVINPGNPTVKKKTKYSVLVFAEK